MWRMALVVILALVAMSSCQSTGTAGAPGVGAAAIDSAVDPETLPDNAPRMVVDEIELIDPATPAVQEYEINRLGAEIGRIERAIVLERQRIATMSGASSARARSAGGGGDRGAKRSAAESRLARHRRRLETRKQELSILERSNARQVIRGHEGEYSFTLRTLGDLAPELETIGVGDSVTWEGRRVRRIAQSESWEIRSIRPIAPAGTEEN